MKFLDKTGLTRLWANILVLVNNVTQQKIDAAVNDEYILYCGTSVENVDNDE